VRFFCPACWSEVPETAGQCPDCGADLSVLDADAFQQKLVRALDSVQSTTARRAAEILSKRGAESALLPMLRRLRGGPDPYLAAAIATAIGRIGGGRAERVLQVLVETSTASSGGSPPRP